MERTQLIENNMKLVYAVVNKHYPKFAKDEDILQCGRVGLCRAANTWDQAKGEFSTYAYHCIHNEIRREFRDYRSKQIPTISLDYEVTGYDGDKIAFGELLVGEKDIDYFDTQHICKHLNQRDIEFLELKKAGLTSRQIGAMYGCSHETVNKSIRKVKKLLNKKGD